MESNAPGAADSRFEPAAAPNGSGAGQEAAHNAIEPPAALPPPPQPMEISEPAPEPVPEPMQLEEPERDAPEPTVAPEEDAPAPYAPAEAPGGRDAPAPFAPREAPESEMPAPPAPETTPPAREPEAAAAPEEPEAPEPEAPEAPEAAAESMAPPPAREPEAAAAPEPEAAAEAMAPPEPEAPEPEPEARPVAARMSSEAEAAALLEATTTTVATAAAALEAEAAKPDELQLEIEAARAKARAAQEPQAPQEADAPPPVPVSEKPPLTEDAISLVDRAAPIEVLQDNPKKGESAKRFRKYMAATNAAEFIQLGGTRADLKYDIARGWVTVTDRAPPPAREKKAKQERGELVFEQNIPKLRSQVPPPTKDDEAIARAAQLAEEEEPEPEGPKEPADWRTSGPFVGQWITRSILDSSGQVTSFSVGQVKGYLNSKESDYLDANGRPTALWRVEYVSGELKDDAEDLERHEVLQSAPKPSRPDLSMREVEAQSKARAREGGSSKGSKKKEREPALDYVPPVESEYERHRRERIAENQRFLQSLGFVGGDVGIPKEQKKTRGPRKKREPQAPTRRSSRATHEAGQYNENRQYRDAVQQVREEQRLEAQRRQERRLEKRMARKSEEEVQRMRKRVERLTRAARAAEKELAARQTEDGSKLRQVGSKPSTLYGGGPVDEQTGKTLDRRWCSRNVQDAPQVGDIVVYFARGHEEALQLRLERSGFACGPSWSEARTPSWFLQQGAPEVLECVVAAIEPRFPDEWLKRRREAFLACIETLEQQDDAHWFLQPLDHQGLGLYDYLKVIRRPMDLASLREGIFNGAYDNDGFDERSRQFADDLKLPFDNALLYNEDTSDVSASARVMLAKCEELIESLRYEEPPEPEEPLLELPPAKKRRFAGRWAEDEEASLKELVKELGDNAWDQVAERLGTGRSARGAEQHWEVMRGTHAFARKRKGPPPKAPPKRSPKKEPEPEPEPVEPEPEPAPAEDVKPSLPPLKMELVVRLVPLYMVQDTQNAGSDIPEASGVTCIQWQTWRGGNLVDPFFVSLSGVPQEDAFLQHRHRVLSSTKVWRGVEQWSSVCTADDRTPYRIESLRRAEKKSASYLPSWRAAKLLECGLPDDPPPPPSKQKAKKRKLTKGKGKKHAPAPPKAPVVKEEDPRLVGVNVWDLRELNADEKAAASKLHESRPEGYEIEEVQERTTRGKKRELDEEPDIEFLERPPEPRPDEVDLPLELEVLDEDMSNALIEALAAVRSTESGSRYWRSWSDDGGYSSEEDEAGNQIKRSGPGVRAMRQKKRAEELQEKRLAKLLPRCQRAPGASCLKDIQRSLMKNAYRRVEAVFDDVARVYRDSAQAAKDGKDPELLSSALCVQLCFEVMEDAATSVGAGGEWRPKTRELANQAAALRPQPWQSHVRRTQSMKTNTGVMIRENVKLGVKASIARDKSRPVQNACIASELHLALAIYVGNAAGPCKETAGRVLDLYGDWHLGADRKEASDVVQMVPVKGGKIQGSLVAADEEEVQERRLLVGRKFKRPGLALDIGTVQDYDRDAKKYRASYADGGEELISIADVTSGLLAFLPAVNMAALDAAAAARAAEAEAPPADETMPNAPAAAESTKELNEEGAKVTTVATSPVATAAPPAEPDAKPVELPDQRAVLFPELVGAPAPAAAPMDTAPDAAAAPADAAPEPAAPEAAPADAEPADKRWPQGDVSPAVTRGATAEPEPEPPAPPKVREHDAHVTIRCGGTKLWCARDARDLLKALAAFNKGVQKEKKTKSRAARKSRRRS